MQSLYLQLLTSLLATTPPPPCCPASSPASPVACWRTLSWVRQESLYRCQFGRSHCSQIFENFGPIFTLAQTYISLLLICRQAHVRRVRGRVPGLRLRPALPPRVLLSRRRLPRVRQAAAGLPGSLLCQGGLQVQQQQQ